MYVAGKRLDIPGRGIVEPGTPLPEAAGWKRIRSYLDQRIVVIVPDVLSPDEPPGSAVVPLLSDGGLRAALIEVLKSSKAHSAGDLWNIALAAPAAYHLPSRRPPTKRRTIALLAECVGLEV